MEIGASAGKEQSRSLFLEKELGWTGILTEHVEKDYQNLLKTGRRAFMLNACVGEHSLQDISSEPLECFPLYDILVAAQALEKVNAKNENSTREGLSKKALQLVNVWESGPGVIKKKVNVNALIINAAYDVQEIITACPWELIDAQVITSSHTMEAYNQKRLIYKYI